MLSFRLKKQTSKNEAHITFNNLPTAPEGPLNCICTHVSIKVNMFIQKKIDHVYSYLQKSMKNCLLLFALCFFLDIDMHFFNFLENLLIKDLLKK